MQIDTDGSFTAMAFETAQYNPEHDKKLRVDFRLQPWMDENASAREGRPIFKDLEFVRIIVPGDRNTIIDREVWPSDRVRFAEKYRAFKEGREQESTGTSLEAWPSVTRAQVEELKFFKIKTVEQLADMDDSLGTKFMGFQKLKQAAKDFLAAANGAAVGTQLRAELAERDTAIAVLQAQVQELLAARSPAPAPAKR